MKRLLTIGLLIAAAMPVLAGYNPLVVATGSKGNGDAKWGPTATMVVVQGTKVIGDARWGSGDEPLETAAYKVTRIAIDGTESLVKVGEVSTPQGDFGDSDFSWTPSEPGQYRTYSKGDSNPDWVKGPKIAVEPAIRILSRRKSAGGEFGENGTEIAAGGLDSDIHIGEIKILVHPEYPSSEGIFWVKFAGDSEGAGYDMTDYTGPNAIPARLTVAAGGLTFGQSGFRVITPGEVFTLRSSNRVETVILEVGHFVESQGGDIVVARHTIRIARPQITIDIPDPLEELFGGDSEYHDVNVIVDFLGEPVAGHKLAVGVAAVRYLNGEGETVEKKISVDATSTELDQYVKVHDSDEYRTDSTDAEGKVTFHHRVVAGANVLSYDIGVADLHVQDESLEFPEGE